MRTLLLLCIVGILAVACDPAYVFLGCQYDYPIDAQGLQRTIKVNDTIWIINDLDAHLCKKDGILEKGKGFDEPVFLKLGATPYLQYKPIILEYANVTSSFYVVRDYIQIPICYVNKRYQWKYGIVFKEPGIYSMSRFGAALNNNKDNKISIFGYFNVSSNNSDLLPEGVASPEPELGSEYRYEIYYLEVVE